MSFFADEACGMSTLIYGIQTKKSLQKKVVATTCDRPEGTGCDALRQARGSSCNALRVVPCDEAGLLFALRTGLILRPPRVRWPCPRSQSRDEGIHKAVKST